MAKVSLAKLHSDELADIAVHHDIQPSNAESFYNGISCLRWKVEGFCEYLNIWSFMLSVSEEINTLVQQQKFTNVSDNFLEEMIHFRTLHPKNLISGHININGFRNKFYEISDLLTQSLLDILFVSETKLDMSFPNIQFNVPGFKCHRADRNSRGGGHHCVRTKWSPSPPAGWPRNSCKPSHRSSGYWDHGEKRGLAFHLPL